MTFGAEHDEPPAFRASRADEGEVVTQYNAASANYADAELVEEMRGTLRAHQRHLAAHDEQLASGNRMFEAIDRNLRVHFQLICLLWLTVLTAIILAVTL